MTPREIILYGLVALVPVVFYRGTTEVFEFPKTELLATGALFLFGASLACAIEKMRGMGRRRLGARVAELLRHDPLGASILLFLLSATLSAFASIRPDASVFGAHESEAGLKTAFATAIVYFTSRSLASEPRHFPRLVQAAATGLGAAVSYAGLQLAGLDPFPWTRSATLGGLRRIPGTLGHANHLGATIAMTLPVLAWLAHGWLVGRASSRMDCSHGGPHAPGQAGKSVRAVAAAAPRSSRRFWCSSRSCSRSRRRFAQSFCTAFGRSRISAPRPRNPGSTSGAPGSVWPWSVRCSA